jgi:hypothetical protein
LVAAAMSCVRPNDVGNVAAMDLGIGQDGNRGCNRAARNLSQKHSVGRRSLTELGQRFVIDLFAGDVHIHAIDRHVQQLTIIHLFGGRNIVTARSSRHGYLSSNQLLKYFPCAHHSDDVALIEHCI